MTGDAAGGVWQYSVDLIAGLAQHGLEVLLATMGPRPSAEQRAQLRRTPSAQLIESDFALEWTQDPWTDVARAGEWLLQLEDRWKPDVIHLNGYALASEAWYAPVISVAHSCVYSWWEAVHRDSPGAHWLEYKQRVMRGLKAAEAIVAPSVSMADAVVCHYELGRDRLSVIHNFSLAELPSDSAKEPYILAAGRLWDKAKNIGLLASVATDVWWPVCVAGEQKGESLSEGLCRWGQLSHPALLETMLRASIFVHPALYEPFGLAVLEAAKARCCLVLADIPSLRELWEGAAVFVDPHREQSWISELNHLIANAPERARLSALAYDRAQRYDPARSTTQYIDVYEACLSKKRACDGVAA